jgi:preprotein translocase SecF subunit
MSFVALRKYAFLISAVLLIAGALSLVTNGLNYGIDFTGGTIMHVNIGEDFSVEDVREVLAPLGLEGATIQRVGFEVLGESEAFEVLIKTAELTPAERDDVFSALQGRYSLIGEEPLRAESVGAVVGSELQRQAFWALLIASVCMVVYITLRFEYRFALTAIAALVHDGLLVLMVFSVMQIEVNAPFIAAILITLGYSINDTIVIFDRIRENLKNQRKEKFAEIVDNSIRLSLRRSINTSATTLLVLLTIFAFGGITLRPFISAMLVGVVFGTYSSIFIASPLWLAWKQAELRKRTSAKIA